MISDILNKKYKIKNIHAFIMIYILSNYSFIDE